MAEQVNRPMGLGNPIQRHTIQKLISPVTRIIYSTSITKTWEIDLSATSASFEEPSATTFNQPSGLGVGVTTKRLVVKRLLSLPHTKVEIEALLTPKSMIMEA